MVVGNLTIDDVVLPDGTTRMASVGGNSLYAALGARPWQPSIGLVTRRGDDFPGDLAAELEKLGIASEGVVEVPGPTVRNWVVYEANGDRHWIYRTPRERSVNVAVQAGDLPESWLTNGHAPVVHVAAMPIEAAEAVVDAVRRMAPEALISLDTHEDTSFHIERGSGTWQRASKRFSPAAPSSRTLSVTTTQYGRWPSWPRSCLRRSSWSSWGPTESLYGTAARACCTRCRLRRGRSST